jgi:hypothetical protein
VSAAARGAVTAEDRPAAASPHPKRTPGPAAQPPRELAATAPKSNGPAAAAPTTSTPIEINPPRSTETVSPNRISGSRCPAARPEPRNRL